MSHTTVRIRALSIYPDKNLILIPYATYCFAGKERLNLQTYAEDHPAKTQQFPVITTSDGRQCLEELEVESSSSSLAQLLTRLADRPTKGTILLTAFQCLHRLLPCHPGPGILGYPLFESEDRAVITTHANAVDELICFPATEQQSYDLEQEWNFQ